jgi:hypothetical protein
MKNILIVFSLVLLTIGCQKDEKEIFIPKNYLEEFQTEKIQIFDLDTLSSKEIKGKNGTIINFNRSDFEVNTNELVTLELLELYDFKEILYRNLSTITTDNELLETNGVLYISFKSNNEEIKLKENKVLMVYPPKGKLENYNIYNLTKDSLENNKWEISKQDYVIVELNKGTSWSPIIVESLIHKDSVAYYKKLNEIALKKESVNSSNKLKYLDNFPFFIVNNKGFGYINLDRILASSKKINFKLNNKKQKFTGFNVYYTYENLKSFLYYPRPKGELDFTRIPIRGKTWVTVISELEGVLYYDRIKLNEYSHNSEFILDMKKTTNEALQKLLTN